MLAVILIQTTMTEIEKSIIQKVKEKLNIKEDVDIFHLHDLLYKTRNKSHPDLFDESFKEDATKKFSELNLLLGELKNYIDNNRLKNVGNDLIIYSENYDNILYKSQIINLENEILRLKMLIDEKSKEIISLSNKIKILEDSELNEIEKKLKELYHPKKNSFIVMGLTAGLIFLINILVYIGKLKDTFQNVFPFPIQTINIFLLILFIFAVIKILFKNYHFDRIRKIGDELKTNSEIQQFLDKYVKYTECEDKQNYGKVKFTESQAEKFIEDLYYNNKIKFKLSLLNNFRDYIIFPNKAKNINYLKDIFLHNLINKELIKIGNSRLLDREFKIKNYS